MKKRVFRINGDDVRLIVPPGKTLLDDMKWLRFVMCTPATPFIEVDRPSFLIAGECGPWGLVAVGRAGG